MVAKQAKSSNEVYDKLIEFDFPEGDKIKKFANDLYDNFGVKNFKPKLSVR